MKNKKFLAANSVLLALCFVAGCGGGGISDSSGKGSSEVWDSGFTPSGTLNIFVNNQGYGRDWLDALGAKFNELTGVEVRVVPDVSNSVGTDAIGQEKSTYDLVFSGGPLVQYVYSDQLADISDIVAAAPEGETETVGEKLARSGLDSLYRFGDRYYMIPWQKMLAGLHYNKTVLDGVFGAGEWEEPVTSDEFTRLLSDLNAVETGKVKQDASYAGKRAYGITISPELNYWAYVVETWWAQYEGFDDFYNYYYGEYYEGGEKKVAKDAEGYGKSLDAKGRLKALEAFERFIKKSAGNVNPVSEGLGYIDHQKQLASGVYQSNTNPSAFLSCGDWYERETYAAVKENGEPVRFMRTPVLSSIVEQLENKTMTDETLAEIVRAIDEGAASYAGVSASDFARIKEARQMVTCGALGHAVGIPKKARNIDNAKAFLLFMTSELGQSIFASACGGLTQPYGYDASSNQSIVMSEYVKSLNNAYKNGFKVVTIDYKAPLVTLGGLDNYGGQGYLDANFWLETKKADSFHKAAVSYEKARYSSVKNYIAPAVR